MDYLNHAALFTNQDVGAPGDKVRLMTVHTAKGLEFPYVFLCGLNEGIFPSRKTRTPEAMEEERRLAFVAMTRAEKGLYLSDAEGLHIDGSLRYPSRFIFDIEPELLEFTAPLPEKLVRDAKDYIRASSRRLLRQAEPAAFRAGTRITHRVFGDGTIVALDAEKGAYVIHFDELATNRSISFRVKLQQL